MIQAQFKRGPGHTKVRSREYELYDGTFADIALIKEQSFCPIPGMSIIMAFIIGQYAGSEHCPRLGCKSQSFKRQGISIKSRVWQVAPDVVILIYMLTITLVPDATVGFVLPNLLYQSH